MHRRDHVLLLFVIIFACLFGGAGCSNDDQANNPEDTETESSGDVDTDVDTDADTDVDADTDTETPAGTTILSTAGFETGDTSEALYNNGTLVQTDCHTGLYCIEHQVLEICDNSLMTTLAGFSTTDHIAAAAWFRFPASWSWEQSDVCVQAAAHKAIILELVDGSPEGSGRTTLLFWGSSDGQFRVRSSGSDEPYTESQATMPTDGNWHYIEIYLERRAGAGAGHVRVMLDDTAVIDSAMTTCLNPCSPINRVKFGAYQNFAYAAAPQSFHIDDLVVADGPLY